MPPKKAKADPGRDALKGLYTEALDRIERLYHRLHDVVKIEFDRMGWHDINPVQALIVFNLGADVEMTAGELRSRGIYNGTNATYNLKYLIKNNYIASRVTDADRRRTLIKLTPKGEEVAEVVGEMFDRHVLRLDIGGLGSGRLEELNATLGRVERFWHDAAAYKL